METAGNRTSRKSRTVKKKAEDGAEGKNMKEKPQITVSVVFPDTEEGMRELNKRLAVFRSNLVGMAIDKLDLPLEDKRAVLDYICDNHIDIWHPKTERDGNPVYEGE